MPFQKFKILPNYYPEYNQNTYKFAIFIVIVRKFAIFIVIVCKFANVTWILIDLMTQNCDKQPQFCQQVN